jgi:hypothetical protein
MNEARKPTSRAERVESPKTGTRGKVDPNRYKAVRDGQLDADLVYNGLTTIPGQAETDTADLSGEYEAVAEVRTHEGAIPEDTVKTTVFRPGDTVRDVPDDQLRIWLRTGAIRKK